MIAVDMNKIKKDYGITKVLSDFSLTVNTGERVALIGPNGSGKSTVLKIIAGREGYESGTLSLKRDLVTGYLEQIPDLQENRTLYEEIESVFGYLKEIECELNTLEEEISEAGAGGEEEKLNKLMTRYGELRSEFENKGGYKYKSKIKQVAVGLGFTHSELNRKVEILSGGERTRLGLVKLLLTAPDILLLDEPTNHLDIPSRRWLEDYLDKYHGTVIIVSHDRYFLDRVVDRVVELKNGSAELYYGNYSYYLEERKKRYQNRLQTYKTQQKKIEKLEEAINKLHRWSSRGDNPKLASRAKSMEKRLERMEKPEKPRLGGEKIRLSLDFNGRSGDEVLKIRDLRKSFAGDTLLQEINLNIYWQEKSAIIGKNGSGKTTILKMITGELKPDEGQIEIGSGVNIGYYSQKFKGFADDEELLWALRKSASMSEQEARDALAAFLFTGDDVFKKISDLSGGEKSRLRLLELMNGDYNFLVLDEPTNHLDLPSREVLEEVIADYPGTVLVVSHDRYFLNKFVDYTYELERGRLTKYYGNYDYYREKKERRKQNFSDETEKEESGKREDNSYTRWKKKQREQEKQERKIQELEEEIVELETEQERLERAMAEPENIADYSLLRELQEEYDELKEKLNNLYKAWETYAKKISGE